MFKGQKVGLMPDTGHAGRKVQSAKLLHLQNCTGRLLQGNMAGFHNLVGQK